MGAVTEIFIQPSVLAYNWLFRFEELVIFKLFGNEPSLGEKSSILHPPHVFIISTKHTVKPQPCASGYAYHVNSAHDRIYWSTITFIQFLSSGSCRA